jgi:peptidylprolyl isomerase
LRADLVVDQPPGSLRADYDLLLGDPTGGSMALSWRPDDGEPWSVSYAEHWAANFVVSIDGEGVTVQQALLALRRSATAHPDLLAELVNQRLLLRAIEREQPPVADDELQDAADRFRRANGLHSAAESWRWLERMGLTQEQFEAMLTLTEQGRKIKECVAAERLDTAFEAHRADYDQVQLLEVQASTPALAEQLAIEARTVGLLAAAEARLRTMPATSLEGTFRRRYASALPPTLRAAATGEIVGPYGQPQRTLVAQVYCREAARLDGETRSAVEDAVFQEWLAQQQNAATVEWHWA